MAACSESMAPCYLRRSQDSDPLRFPFLFQSPSVARHDVTLSCHVSLVTVSQVFVFDDLDVLRCADQAFCRMLLVICLVFLRIGPRKSRATCFGQGKHSIVHIQGTSCHVTPLMLTLAAVVKGIFLSILPCSPGWLKLAVLCSQG